jgi:hypothetical protein
VLVGPRGLVLQGIESLVQDDGGTDWRSSHELGGGGVTPSAHEPTSGMRHETSGVGGAWEEQAPARSRPQSSRPPSAGRHLRPESARPNRDLVCVCVCVCVCV